MDTHTQEPWDMLERFLKPGGALTALAAGATLLTGAPAPAQTDLGNNAALRYWQAFSIIDNDIRETTNQIAKRMHDSPIELSPEEQAAMETSADTVTLLLEASSMKSCEFGIQYEKGPGAILPHLGAMRSGALLLQVDARLRWSEADPHAAVERAAAIIRMSHHLSDERLLISSLVSASIFSGGADLISALDDAGVLGDDQRAALLAALSEFDAADPFGTKRSLIAERDIISAWARDQIASGEAATTFTDAASLLTNGTEADWEHMDADSLHAYVDLYVAAFDQILAAWEAPDYAERFAAIEGEVASGGFGPVAKAMLPSLGAVKRNSVSGAELYSRLRERLSR
jgi:hypothetical protein